jgi:hypothetical protein
MPKVKRSKATKITELVSDAEMDFPDATHNATQDATQDAQDATQTNPTTQTNDKYKSPVPKKREPKVPGAPKKKRKAEAPPEQQHELQEEHEIQQAEPETKRCDAIGCEAAPKKPRAKKPKAAGYLSSVDNDHVLFKTHKEAYDYWRSKQGEGENKGGIYECNYNKPLEKASFILK